MNNPNWNKLWKLKSEFLQPKHKQALELLNIIIKKGKIKSICDFGCGQGLLLNEINEIYKHENIKIYGADNTNFSKKKVEKLGIEYFTFDLLKSENIKDIEVAILTDVLEHFYNPLEVINNLSNIKYLIIIVPNFNFITERLSVINGNIPFQMKPKRGGHFFWFNEQSLKNIVDNSDYEIIEKLNIYPKKLNYIPVLKKINNLFATSFGLLLKKKI